LLWQIRGFIDDIFQEFKTDIKREQRGLINMGYKVRGLNKLIKTSRNLMERTYLAAVHRNID